MTESALGGGESQRYPGHCEKIHICLTGFDEPPEVIPDRFLIEDRLVTSAQVRERHQRLEVVQSHSGHQ
jgi:hypothetical protein